MKQQEVKLIDDLTGDPADDTVEFGLDGVIYQVDLTDPNAKTLREGLLPYKNVGQRVGSWKVAPPVQTHVRMPLPSAPAKRPNPRASSPSGLTKEGRDACREWGRKVGAKVPERGRLPQSLVEAFLAEHYPDGRVR